MDMKRDYYEDVQLCTSGVVVFWLVALLIGLAALPFLASSYTLYMANFLAINVIVVIGLNILVGYAGQVSLGHAGFFAIGAYGTVILMSEAHLPFFAALVLAALIAAAFGFLLGLPALRLEGPYLAIATLGFGLTITQIIGRIELFGGRQGLHTPDLIIGPWHLESDRDFYFLLIPITVLLAIAGLSGLLFQMPVATVLVGLMLCLPAAVLGGILGRTGSLRLAIEAAAMRTTRMPRSTVLRARKSLVVNASAPIAPRAAAAMTTTSIQKVPAEDIWR